MDCKKDLILCKNMQMGADCSQSHTLCASPNAHSFTRMRTGAVQQGQHADLRCKTESYHETCQARPFTAVPCTLPVLCGVMLPMLGWRV